MLIRIKTFIAALAVCAMSTGFAEDGTPPPVTEDIIGHIVESLGQSLQKFECQYLYSTKVLPGYSEWIKAVSSPDEMPPIPNQNKDGYNEVYYISYKRLKNSFHLKLEDRFDPSSIDTIEYHSDGTLFWENRHVNKRINLLSRAPSLPLLYDNLLKAFPSDSSQYSNALIAKTSLTDQLNDSNNNVKISPNNDGTIDLQIIQPNDAHPIRGMKRLHRFSIDLKSGFEIKRYAYGAIYQENNRKNIFRPLFEIEFSEFRSIETGTPKIPGKIKVTEHGIKSNVIPRNIEELIELDKQWVPLKVYTLELQNFNLHPKFNDGEINFAYPAGTQVIDMFANRVYLTGDTLEVLSEKVKPKDNE